jgi:hypothetical protein
MLGYLWLMCELRPEAEAALMSLSTMITSTDPGFWERRRCRRELHRLDREYGRGIYPPDPNVFVRRYPDLLSSQSKKTFDFDAFWENLQQPVSAWLALSESDKLEAAKAFLKHEYPENYPNYDANVFFVFKIAITKEVEGVIANPAFRADTPLCGVAVMAVLALSEAIQNRDFSKLV